MRQIARQINWVATQCRPDISYESCVLGDVADKAVVSGVSRANKIVRKVQGQSLNLSFSSDSSPPCNAR